MGWRARCGGIQFQTPPTNWKFIWGGGSHPLAPPPPPPMCQTHHQTKKNKKNWIRTSDPDTARPRGVLPSAVLTEPRPGKLIPSHSPRPTNGASLVEAPKGQIRTRDPTRTTRRGWRLNRLDHPIKRIDWFRWTSRKHTKYIYYNFIYTINTVNLFTHFMVNIISNIKSFKKTLQKYA